MPDDRAVLAAAGCVRDALGGLADRDWAGPVPHLEWTVAETVAHLAKAAFYCGIDLAACGPDLRATRLTVAGSPAELLDAVDGGARLTAHVVRAAPPDALGYDPDGPADASGFAAMCCDELLVHGWDAARGLGADLRPDDTLAARVPARLFPWVPPEPDGWSALLWANGRLDLPGRDRPRDWTWHVAPLSTGHPSAEERL